MSSKKIVPATERKAQLLAKADELSGTAQNASAEADALRAQAIALEAEVTSEDIINTATRIIAGNLNIEAGNAQLQAAVAAVFAMVDARNADARHFAELIKGASQFTAPITAGGVLEDLRLANERITSLETAGAAIAKDLEFANGRVQTLTDELAAAKGIADLVPALNERIRVLTEAATKQPVVPPAPVPEPRVNQELIERIHQLEDELKEAKEAASKSWSESFHDLGKEAELQRKLDDAEDHLEEYRRKVNAGELVYSTSVQTAIDEAVAKDQKKFVNAMNTAFTNASVDLVLKSAAWKVTLPYVKDAILEYFTEVQRILNHVAPKAPTASPAPIPPAS